MSNRIRGLLSIAFACAVLAINAQEADSSQEDATDTQTERPAQNQDTENRDQPEQSEETSDDVFDPSEDISEDYAVPYPTDI